jgi:hypothetical protein
VWRLSSAVAFALATALSWAALEKARHLSSITETVHLLGCPAWLARPAAVSLIIVEIAVALGLAYDWSSPWTRAGVAALGILFAAAGALALRSGKQIRCNCFGGESRRALGLTQIATLPLWLFGAALLGLAPHSPSPGHATMQLAAVGVCLAAIRVPAVLRARRDAYADRRSAQETYLWLR